MSYKNMRGIPYLEAQLAHIDLTVPYSNNLFFSKLSRGYLEFLLEGPHK